MGKYSGDFEGEYGRSRRERRAQDPKHRPARMRQVGKSVFTLQTIINQRSIEAARRLKERAQWSEVSA